MSDNRSMKSMLKRTLRLSDICHWVNDELDKLLTEDTGKGNPFGRELSLDMLLRFAREITKPSSWHDRALYSEWVKHDGHGFVPAAFSEVSVWDDDRERAMTAASLAAERSLRQYAVVYPPIRFSASDFIVEPVCNRLANDIRLYTQLGRRIQMFGSILNIESVVRLTEQRVRVAAADLFAELRWNYQADDFAVAEYLRGKCEGEIEDLFFIFWNDYTMRLGGETDCYPQ